MKKQLGTLFVVAVLMLANAALAHRAFAPVYDGERIISVVGTVLEFNLVNPHSTMLLETASYEGTTETWTVEFDGLLNLTVAGWTEQTITVGEKVSVEGNPTHTGSARMFFTRLVREDGSELIRPILDRSNAIDELRRRRATQRNTEN